MSKHWKVIAQVTGPTSEDILKTIELEFWTDSIMPQAALEMMVGTLVMKMRIRLRQLYPKATGDAIGVVLQGQAEKEDEEIGWNTIQSRIIEQLSNNQEATST